MRAERAARRAPPEPTTPNIEWERVPRSSELVAMSDERAAQWVAQQADPQSAGDYADLVRHWSAVENDASRIGDAAFDIANGGAAPDTEVGRYGQQLARFMDSAPTIDQRLYRGMEWTDDVPARGDVVALRPSSFSRGLDTAVGYADAQMGAGENVIVEVLPGARGLPVDGLSSWSAGEEEVISGGMFEVVSARSDGEFLRLTVRQV